MKPLTIEQVEIARVKILENSESLLAEAILLFENGCFARAHSLAHFASEEIVKIPMLVRAVSDEAAGIQHDWKKLSKRLTSHTTKIDTAHFHDYLQSEILEDDGDINAYEEALTTTKDINTQKNRSLYCDFDDGNPISPLEVITQEIAHETIQSSHSRIDWVKGVEKLTAGKLEKLLTKEFLERLRRSHAELEREK